MRDRHGPGGAPPRRPRGNRGLLTQRRGTRHPRHGARVHHPRGDAPGAEVLRRERGAPARPRPATSCASCSSRRKQFGFWGLSTPEEYGGMDLPAVTAVADLDRDRAAPSCRSASAARRTTSCSTPTRSRSGSTCSRPSRASGISCFAITEPGAGSDAANIRLTRPPRRRRLDPQRREDVHHQRQRRRLRHRGRGHRPGEGRPQAAAPPRSWSTGRWAGARSSSRRWARAARPR